MKRRAGMRMKMYEMRIRMKKMKIKTLKIKMMMFIHSGKTNIAILKSTC